MSFYCGGCGLQKDNLSVMVVKWGESVNKYCADCRRATAGVSDVYFKQPYWDEHLANEKYPGAKYISSRAEKKMWLEKCNLREDGDRVRGARRFDPISHRHAEESLRRNHHVKR